MEEGIGGAVLGDPVPGDAGELPGVGALRAAGGASREHSGDHH